MPLHLWSTCVQTIGAGEFSIVFQRKMFDKCSSWSTVGCFSVFHIQSPLHLPVTQREHVVSARLQVLVSSTYHFPGTQHLSVHSDTFQSVLSPPHTCNDTYLKGHITKRMKLKMCFSWNSSTPVKQRMLNLHDWSLVLGIIVWSLKMHADLWVLLLLWV